MSPNSLYQIFLDEFTFTSEINMKKKIKKYIYLHLAFGLIKILKILAMIWSKLQ